MNSLHLMDLTGESLLMLQAKIIIEQPNRETDMKQLLVAPQLH